MRSVDGLTPQILIGSTFTATPLQEVLEFWQDELHSAHSHDELHSAHSIEFVGYQQLFQTLLDTSGPFFRNRAGVNVALFRLDDLGSESDTALELANLLIATAARTTVPLLVALCPESPAFLQAAGRPQGSLPLRETLEALLRDRPNLYPLSVGQLISDYELSEIADPLADRAGHVPYHPQFFVALGTQIARTVAALNRQPIKVVAVDCDNTLWHGVCGEDGPEGVTLDLDRIALQQALLQQKQRGVLLALNSKNNENDVQATFAAHPDMPLKWSDFAARRINWQSKTSNFFDLANELSLGLDSFVFLDDDAKECAEVRQNCPAVVTLQVPGAGVQFWRHIWPFDRLKPVTPEDLKRSQLYAEQTERNQFERQSGSLRDFLSGLHLQIGFAPVTVENLPRVAQLTQRTNQMNTTLVRYSEAELSRRLAAGMQALAVTVSDRFGDYGLVGAAFAELDGEALILSGLLLSCRALGRGVEHKMLAHVAALAERLGKTRIDVPVVVGPRNQPALQFIAAVFGGAPGNQTASTSPSTLKTLELQIKDRPHALSIRTKPAQLEQESARVDYQRIATALDTAFKIEAEMHRLKKLRRGPARSIEFPPQTELERNLASIWCDLLALDSIGVDEDFFDLGGHSLLAVQLLSRIHRDLAIDLPDGVIYGEKLRISNLARTIELLELGIEDQQAYDAALADIESLSDEEVAALLAEEGLSS